MVWGSSGMSLVCVSGCCWVPLSITLQYLLPLILGTGGGCMYVLTSPFPCVFTWLSDSLGSWKMSKSDMCHFRVGTFKRQCLVLHFPSLMQPQPPERPCPPISVCQTLPMRLKAPSPTLHFFPSLSHKPLMFGGCCYCSITYMILSNTDCKWSEQCVFIFNFLVCFTLYFLYYYYNNITS